MNDKGFDSLLGDSSGPSTMREAVLNMRKDLSDYKDMVSIMSEMLRSKYDALLREGFTAEQALDLCHSLEF